MNESFLEASEAHQQAQIDRAIEACRHSATEQALSAVGVCYNCGEPIADGETFCSYVESGESQPACLSDWRKRTRRGVAK